MADALDPFASPESKPQATGPPLAWAWVLCGLSLIYALGAASCVGVMSGFFLMIEEYGSGSMVVAYFGLTVLGVLALLVGVVRSQHALAAMLVFGLLQCLGIGLLVAFDAIFHGSWSSTLLILTPMLLWPCFLLIVVAIFWEDAPAEADQG